MIDWARSRELRDEIGPEDFEEVVELFLEEMEDEISALQSHADPSELESRLHSLKGSALNLGFAQFATLCQAGETAASKAEYEEIDIPAICGSYETSKSTFLSDAETQFAA